MYVCTFPPRLESWDIRNNLLPFPSSASSAALWQQSGWHWLCQMAQDSPSASSAKLVRLYMETLTFPEIGTFSGSLLLEVNYFDWIFHEEWAVLSALEKWESVELMQDFLPQSTWINLLFPYILLRDSWSNSCKALPINCTKCHFCDIFPETISTVIEMLKLKVIKILSVIHRWD